MEFFGEVANTFINNIAGFYMVDGMRYLIGAGGTFLVVWVLLKGVLAARRIRKPLPAMLLHKQMLRELRNSAISILVFAVAFSVTNGLIVLCTTKSFISSFILSTIARTIQLHLPLILLHHQKRY